MFCPMQPPLHGVDRIDMQPSDLPSEILAQALGMGPALLLQLLLLTAATHTSADPLSPQQRAASRWSGAWPATAPPASVPSSTAVDGPLVGNGDVGLVAGVKGGTLSFYISKSDFWFLKPMGTGPKTLGGVSFSPIQNDSAAAAPAAAFALRQDIGRGVVDFNMSLGTGSVVLSGWVTVSQDDGVSQIVWSLDAVGGVDSTLSVDTWGAKGAKARSTGTAAWISRSIGGCSNATASIATAVVGGGNATHVHVRSGEPTVLVSAVVSSLDLGHRTGQCSWLWRDPVPAAVASVAAVQSIAAAMAIAADSQTFWKQFWAKSVLSMPSRPEAEHFWFSSQYILGSSSRGGRSCNGIWGLWVTTDDSAWGGAFTIDYNAEAPFYGVFGANHPEIARPYFEPILEYAREHGGDDAAAYSSNFSSNCSTDGGVGGMPGVIHMPGVIGQHGFIDHGDMSMHSDASFAILNFINYYRYTQNSTFLKDVSYPLVRGVAAWWLCWLHKVQLPGGGYQYNDMHDCTYENCMWCGRDFEPPRDPPNECHTANNINPSSTIAFVHFILTHLIEVADAGLVNPPAAELAQWHDVVSHLAPIPTGYTNCTGTGVSHPARHAAFSQNLTCTFATADNGSKVLLPQESPWFFTTRYNPLEFYSIWPGEMIGLGSDPELLRTARATVLKGDAFAQNNAFCEAFPAAVRVGLNASFVLAQLTTLIRSQMLANGLVTEAGGGYETAGASIAVQEMLLQSHEGYLRFFPAFPSGEPASFSGLRAVGAFVVSASLDQSGTVSGIEIESEAGRNCSIYTRSTEGLVVTDDASKTVPTWTANVSGVQVVQFATRSGHRYKVQQELKREQLMMKPDDDDDVQRPQTLTKRVPIRTDDDGLNEQSAIEPEPDVLWTTPSKNVSGSMPVGNGNVGVNVYSTRADEVQLLISHTDSVDETGALVKIGRLVVRLVGAGSGGEGGTFRAAYYISNQTICFRLGHVHAQVWVDANLPVVRMSSTGPAHALEISLRMWKRSGPVQDVLVPNATDSLAWFHNNSAVGDPFAWEYLLQYEGLGDFTKLSTSHNPLANVTFGGYVHTSTEARANSSGALVTTAATSQLLSVAADVCKSGSLAEFLAGLRMHASTAVDRAAHTAVWDDFHSRSFINITAAPSPANATLAAFAARVTLLDRVSRTSFHAMAGNGQSQYAIKFNDYGIFSSHNGSAAGKADNGGFPTSWDSRAWVRSLIPDLLTCGCLPSC